MLIPVLDSIAGGFFLLLQQVSACLPVTERPGHKEQAGDVGTPEQLCPALTLGHSEEGQDPACKGIKR